MKKSRLVWAAVLALLLLVNLVVSAPARLLRLALPGEQLLMHGLAGTVWHGSASSPGASAKPAIAQDEKGATRRHRSE